jgi:hypothetical protein
MSIMVDKKPSRKRVVRLMQEDARVRKRFICTTMSDHDQPVAGNLLNRQFTAEAPNQRGLATRSRRGLAATLRPGMHLRERGLPNDP